MHATRRAPFPFLFTALLALTGAPGCDAPDEDLGAITLRPGGGFGCRWCTLSTGNSPNINGADLSDINLDVVHTNGHNTSGIKLRNGNTPDEVVFRLTVDPATESFVGLGVGEDDYDVAIVSGAGIVGAKIVLEMPNNGQTVYLEITDYDAGIPSWAKNGKPITAYRAQYVGSLNTLQPLCPTIDPENQWFTLVLGETYDQATNEIVARPDSVSLACVGEAAAKMKLMDYGPHGNRQASAKERITTLRMITADYCGTGHSFTASGTAVAWRNDDNSVLPPFEEAVLEAKWGHEGALCLDKPRHASIDDVLEHCEIPTCEGEDFVEGMTWRTMLPE
jgi:hypothetical protein